MKARGVVEERPAGQPFPKGVRMVDGPHEGLSFVLEGFARIGDTVEVEYEPDDQFARVVRSTTKG